MAMTEEEILTGLGEIVDEVAGVPADQVTPDKTFVDDLDIDSLSMVEIAVAAAGQVRRRDPRRAAQGPQDRAGRRRLRQAFCSIGLTGEAKPTRPAGTSLRAPRYPRLVRSTRTVGTDRTRVVVTGLGAITPVGADVASTWQALLAGRSGAVALTEDWAAELPARIAAWAAVDPATLIDRVQARRMDRCEQFALVAAREAWADAGSPEVDGDRLGVVVSSGIGGVASTLNAYDMLKEKGWQRLPPFTVPC